MPKSMLLIPELEDEGSQPLYEEGTHTPDELARASGVWIGAAGSGTEVLHEQHMETDPVSAARRRDDAVPGCDRLR